MQDLRFVSFVLRPRDARRVIEETGLAGEARVDERDALAHCIVPVDAADSRLLELLARLEARGETPLVRAERKWSKRELDSCDRLLLRIETAGLDGGIGFGQDYDRSRACATCGAGAVPLPPLVADLPRMGRKHIDATAHDGLLVVSAALAGAVVADALTGFTVERVRSRSARYSADAHRWLRVVSEWPSFRGDSVVQRDAVCPACERARPLRCVRRVHGATVRRRSSRRVRPRPVVGILGLLAGAGAGHTRWGRSAGDRVAARAGDVRAHRRTGHCVRAGPRRPSRLSVGRIHSGYGLAQ
jgi:hypothetical protein